MSLETMKTQNGSHPHTITGGNLNKSTTGNIMVLEDWKM